MNWDDLRIFKTIAIETSIRKAAIKLKQSHSTISRRLEILEKSLSTKLFFRVSSGLTLTEAGIELLQTVVPLSMKFNSIERAFIGRDQTIEGQIKITLPSMFATHLLFPDILDFQEQWPQINLQIHASNDILDLSNGEADIAIRFTNSPDESLIGRKVGNIYQAAYASNDYINSFKNQQRINIKWVKPGQYTQVEDIDIEYKSTKLIESDLIVNHIDLQIHATEMNKGIALLPCFMADKKNLVRLSLPYQHFGIWLLYSKGLRNNKRVHLFRQFIISRILKYSLLLEGKTKPLYKI